MKDRVLFHLLMARLQVLSHGRSPDEIAFARVLRETLAVTQEGERFSLTWRWEDKDHELSVPGDTFDFYRRGDVGQRAIQRGARTRNWQQAEVVLRRVADMSAALLPLDRQVVSLSTLHFDERQAPTPHVLLIAPALLAGVIAYIPGGLAAAFWTGMVAIALAYLNQYRRDGSLRGFDFRVEPWLIAIGAVLPAWFGIAPAGPAVLACGWALLVRAESNGEHASFIDWGIAGAAIGAIIFAVAAIGFVPVGLLATAVFFVCLAMPNRIRFQHAVVATVAAFAVAMIAALGPFGSAAGPMLTPTAAAWLTWPVVAIFAFCFLSGWVLGSRFLILPWIGLAVVAITCGGFALADRDVSKAAAFAAYLGFGLCIMVRLSYNFGLASKWARAWSGPKGEKRLQR